MPVFQPSQNDRAEVYNVNENVNTTNLEKKEWSC